MILAICAIIVLVLLFLRMPVFVALLSGTVVYFIITPGLAPQIIAQRVLSGVENVPLLAIPFFVCSGIIMNYSGVTQRVLRFCEILVRRLPGGIAQVNVLMSLIMGGLSGSNLADAAMTSKILVPEMEKRGFTKEFSSVLTATSAMITPLIPPGIAMIIYGSMSTVSIGKLFMACIGPGLLLCAALMIYVGYVSKRKNFKQEDLAKGITMGEAFKDAFFPLLLPVVIIGGIRIGAFTPTEAGAVAIIYAIFLSIIYREFRLSKMVQALKETVLSTSSILLIVGAASAFAWVLTREQVPQQLTGTIVGAISNKYLFLLFVNVFILFVGMVIEGNALLIILVPILSPIAAKYGINDIHFAVMFIFNISVGAMTPPVGTLMFVTCGITGCKIADFIKEAVPFYIILGTCLLMLTFVPFLFY